MPVEMWNVKCVYISYDTHHIFMFCGGLKQIRGIVDVADLHSFSYIPVLEFRTMWYLILDKYSYHVQVLFYFFYEHIIHTYVRVYV